MVEHPSEDDLNRQADDLARRAARRTAGRLLKGLGTFLGVLAVPAIFVFGSIVQTQHIPAPAAVAIWLADVALGLSLIAIGSRLLGEPWP